MEASWTSFICATVAIAVLFAVAVWKQIRSSAALTVSADDAALAVAPLPPAPPSNSNDLLERRAALEKLLAAAPPTVGAWEDTAPLTGSPDDTGFAPTMPAEAERVE